MNEGTQLTVIQRAQVALKADVRRTQFVTLAAESADIKTITNADGYSQCHAARMRLKTARVDLTKEGKEVRDDAVKFQKGVIALEKELLDLIEPEENRLGAIQTEFDTRKEREAAERAEKEATRIAKIQELLARLTAAPGRFVGKPSGEIATALADLRAHTVAEWSQEFQAQADEAKTNAVATLEQLHAGALAQEKAAAELAAKQEAERQELARLRAESEARAKADADRQAEIDRQEREAKARIAAEQKAANDKIQAELAESRRVEAEARAVREAAERKATAESETRHAELLRQQEAEQAPAGRAGAERDKQEAARRELERQQAEILNTDALLRTVRERIGDKPQYAAIAAAIDNYHGDPARANKAPIKRAARGASV